MRIVSYSEFKEFLSKHKGYTIGEGTFVNDTYYYHNGFHIATVQRSYATLDNEYWIRD